MQGKIIQFLKNKYDAVDYETLKNNVIGDTNDAKIISEFERALRDLTKDITVYFTNSGKYILTEYMSNFRVGIIDLKDAGFGFLLSEKEGEQDIHISKEYMIGSKDGKKVLDGDTVLVEILGSNKNKPEGKILKIVKRNEKNIVGDVISKNGVMTFKPLDEKYQKINLLIDQNELDKCVDGEVVAISIQDDPTTNALDGIIVAHLGHKDDPDIEVKELAATYGVFSEFPDEVMEQAKSLPNQMREEDYNDREDLRDKLTFTIDGKDTKDIDDAVSLYEEDGLFHLLVSIADVSYYVPENSPLDKEAFKRGTSNYVGYSVFPMYPHLLSNGICSLNEDVDRCAITCEMTIDSKGKVIDSSIYPSVIHSNKKMNYDDVNNIIMRNIVAPGYEPYVDSLKEMNELHKIVRAERQRRGASDFDTAETKFIFNEKHECIDAKLDIREDGEKLIEDFMILANETVSKTLSNYFGKNDGLPCIYRVHDLPRNEKIQSFIQLCESMGYHIVGKFSNITNPTMFKKLLDQLEDIPENDKNVLMPLAIRCMAKAEYSAQNIGHFGLASKYYSHFTSPIRRYPDTTLHRLIRTFLVESKMDDRTINYWNNNLKVISKQSSERERNADELERDGDDMFAAEFMEKHIGEDFDVIISGITEHGIFLEIPTNGVEGMMKIEDLQDDFYIYDETTQSLIGKRTKKTYRLGQRLRVKCIASSKETKKITFGPVEAKILDTSNEEISYSRKRVRR